MKRLTATALVAAYGLVMGAVCSFGFGIWSDFTILGMSILDFMDFISNSVFLPLVGMLTCIVVGFVIKPDAIISEVELNGPFRMKHFYIAMVKWIAPVLIFAILVSGILQSFGILKI